MALFAFLVRRDLAARDKQMARMLREEKLGALQLELANRKARLLRAGSFTVMILSGIGWWTYCASDVYVACSSQPIEPDDVESGLCNIKAMLIQEAQCR